MTTPKTYRASQAAPPPRSRPRPKSVQGPFVQEMTLSGFGVTVRAGDEFRLVNSDTGEAFDLTAITDTNADDETRAVVRAHRPGSDG